MTAPAPFHAIIVAGGQGLRAGLPSPKQYAEIGGRTLIDWCASAFAAHPQCARIILVVPAGDEARAATATSVPVKVAAGGATRQQSVAAGLAAVDDADPVDAVLIHDAARPGLTITVIDALLAALAAGADGAVPALAVADTLAERTGDDVLGPVTPREALARIQTPQAFALSAIRHAHAGWTGDAATDDAQMVRAAGGAVRLVPGDARLDKVTHSGDLDRMAALLAPGASMQQRPAMIPATGQGYDVHRLVPGDGVWLGGVLIPHDRKLDGHSDADVLLHAITDAVLGALGDGDIGEHFPPSDPQWRRASSDRFLAHAVALAAQAGARLTHIDATVICEAPKVGPHRDSIRQSVAAMTGLPFARVSIKATTTERLGFTGRGEGIAAMAVATVLLPDNDAAAL